MRGYLRRAGSLHQQEPMHEENPMFPANEMITAAEVAYRRERMMEAIGPRRLNRRIRLHKFPKIGSLSHLTNQATHGPRAA